MSDFADGGTVTFKIYVEVPISAANPEFTKEDTIAAAITNLGEVEDFADSHYCMSFSGPYEVTGVEPT